MNAQRTRSPGLHQLLRLELGQQLHLPRICLLLVMTLHPSNKSQVGFSTHIYSLTVSHLLSSVNFSV